MSAPRGDLASRDTLTLPELSRVTGIGLKRIRRLAARGKFPVYKADGVWPRVRWHEWLDYLKSTRVPPSAHAEKRLAEYEAAHPEP